MKVFNLFSLLSSLRPLGGVVFFNIFQHFGACPLAQGQRSAGQRGRWQIETQIILLKSDNPWLSPGIWKFCLDMTTLVGWQLKPKTF
jgi:hypothetical protein